MTIPLLYPGPKPPSISEAYEKIKSCYDHGYDLLRSEEPDGVRLKVNADKLEIQIMPLIDELGRMTVVPREWVAQLASAVRDLEEGLRISAEQLQGIGKEREQ